MGFTLSMSRLGDFLTLTLSAIIAKAFGSFIYSLWAGAILCVVSFIAVIVYGIFDRSAERYFPDRKVNPADNELNFKAVLHFDVRFFIVSLLTTIYYAGIFPFVGNSTSFLEKKYGFSKVQAPIYLSIITFSSMILSPVMGKLADIVGRRPYLVCFGSLLVLPAHFLMATTTIWPGAFIAMIGLSFSLVPGCLWPSVPLLVQSNELATAFGLMTAIQNGGLTLANLAAGEVQTKFNDETYMWFFVIIDFIGLLLGILLVIVDHAKGGALMKVTKKSNATASVNDGVLNTM